MIMSKGFILFDIPDNCFDCIYRCYDFDGVHFCSVTTEEDDHTCNRLIDCEVKKQKPKWCPIRELPEKMEVCGKYPQPGKPMSSYRIG